MLSDLRQSGTYDRQEDLAAIYYLLGQYEEEAFNKSGQAFEYYTRSKEYYEIAGDTTMMHTLELKIAERFAAAGMYQEAIELYDEALNYYTTEQDTYKN